MHKLKRPCVCGHRAGKHDKSKKRTLHMPFRSGRQTQPYKNILHSGFCHTCEKEGGSCRAFRESKKQGG